MAFGIGTITDLFGLESSTPDVSQINFETFFRSQRAKRRESTLAKLGTPSSIRAPLLAPVAPPRGATIRSGDPFDFFGTLFTTPATSGLNPITNLNQTVV
jgi:hypothetical protein